MLIQKLFHEFIMNLFWVQFECKNCSTSISLAETSFGGKLSATRGLVVGENSEKGRVEEDMW